MDNISVNDRYLHRLVQMLYDRESCPALDEYGSSIFGRPVENTWRLFRYLTRFSVAGAWMWNPHTEMAEYSSVEVPTIEEFSTFLFHEVTHGWCHFHNKDTNLGNYPTGVDEEQVCWDVSKLVCEFLGLTFHQKSADQSHQFHKLVSAGDLEGLAVLMKELPAHHQM